MDLQATIVTVIEAGPLEKQVCLLANSLRSFGGRLANASMIAVTPRKGPLLARATRRRLAELNVDLAIIKRDDGLNWFPYLNKTAALRFVSRQVQGPVVWLDGDILVLKEPSQLLLDSSEFVACASDKNIGTASDDDDYAPYFRAACQGLGVDYGTLPYVVTESEGIPIRAYWNSGVFAFESASGLAELHHEFTTKLVSKRIGSRKSKLFFSDQIALGLAVHKLSLPFTNLSLSHNRHVQPNDAKSILQSADDIKLLHYHGCMWPGPFDDLCVGLESRNAEAAQLLREVGPLGDGISRTGRIARKVLQLYRRRQEKITLRKVHLY